MSERTDPNEAWEWGQSIIEINNIGRIHFFSSTADELNIVFSADYMHGTFGYRDLWMASRDNRTELFGHIIHLRELSSSGDETSPALSADGLEIYFVSNRNGKHQIFNATRENLDMPFTCAEPLAILDVPDAYSCQPCLSSDGMKLFFCRTYSREYVDIWVSYRTN
jgi:hypothetical protein